MATRRAGRRINMIRNKTKVLGIRRAAIVVGLVGALLMTSNVVGSAQSNDSSSATGLAGTWFVQVTLRDCSTNAPLGQPFNSLVTFHLGGTITETTSAHAFAIGQRSDGQGNWQSEGGNTYNQRTVSLINFDTAPNFPVSPGFFAG
jgi:hypothetical protein